MSQKNYYLGLDIGTDSVGYAATDESYDLLKCAGKPAWGVTVFDEALLKAKRRSFRTARRRLDRRQQRVIFIQELFANEIAKTDSRFYIRLRESSLFRDETKDRYIFFNDTGFTDVEYNDRYPTIHHLIYDLMTNKDPHDVRLVYLACAWLVAHRGHFLSNINVNNLDDVKDFHGVYESFIGFFTNSGYSAPWEEVDIDRLADVLRKKQRIGSKISELTQILYGDTKLESESTDEFPFSRKTIVKLLAGGKCTLSDLFCKDEYSDLGKFSLDSDETNFTEIMSAIGDDYDIIEALRKVYDWSVLADALGDGTTISEAKVKTYEQHKDDLRTLKYIIRKYLPEKYDEVFRSTKDTSYASYVGHTDNKKENIKRTDKLAFSNNLKKIIQGINPEDEDILVFEDMCSRLELYTFLPKQRDGDNRVIPQQLYQYELQVLLKNAAGYLPFLSEEDEDGITVSDKIMSVFLFNIPYFVGPLNPNSPYAWLERKAGKITPWNFESMVDLDKSEQKFIESMTNTCTYLLGEPVLPKDSLLYHKFTVLNEINNLRINGERISVELKQRIYTDLFMKVKKVTRKRLIDYLECNGYIKSDEREAVTGIDIDIKSNLIPQIAFKRLLDTNTLSVEDVEKIIERASYAEDKRRLEDWLEKTYPNITPVDRKYICGIKIKDFGRLSRKFLEELDGVCKATGEVTSIIEALWNTRNNLMELLSDQYTFIEALEDYINEYYCLNKRTLESRLDDMYISNAVKRPIYRMLDIVKDVKRAFGAPEKIFIETTRGATKEQKSKRTVSRKQQIFDLYDKINNEDVRQLREQIEDMGIEADNKLQGDKLFLYYIQLGKCMYSGKAIKLSELSSKAYDIDHIYPQSYVKDDSIINNRVLSLSEMNGIKGDKYPIDENIRASMGGYWEYLRHAGLISEEKYRRLTRATPFTAEEKYGFINRQLTETSQAAKAAATLLKEFFPNTEIVYCRASLVSE
ncbi:MAG: type II CRISPR RNA-guided endonuclease Cas9, partial [Clostridiales bacterium]|nr:type II CRISPR RNA-guided endonuclease Cas9 [Clostridiales bacterium]